MKILRNKKDLITRGSICSIGSFDGVHRGHQEIVKYLKKLGRSEKRVGIITFIPLPFFVLTSAPIICLTQRQEKENIFRQLGVDFIYYFKFTKRVSEMIPDEFVDLVARQISPSLVVVGENFHFGKERKGSATLLQRLAQDKFLVRILPRVKDEGTISSTRIRELLLLGHIAAANKLLGREYTISGRVIRGKGKGTKLGFPTINIRVSKEKLLPLDGVYKVNVFVQGKKFIGAMFLRHDLIEVHILNFSGEVYKREVTVRLLKRIRNIERFVDDDALRLAIAKDVASMSK